jgi:hypothetical protein
MGITQYNGNYTRMGIYDIQQIIIGTLFTMGKKWDDLSNTNFRGEATKTRALAFGMVQNLQLRVNWVNTESAHLRLHINKKLSNVRRSGPNSGIINDNYRISICLNTLNIFEC